MCVCVCEWKKFQQCAPQYQYTHRLLESLYAAVYAKRAAGKLLASKKVRIISKCRGINTVPTNSPPPPLEDPCWLQNHSTAPNTPISAGCASVLVRLLSVWVVQSVFYLLRFDFAMLLLLLLCMAYPRSGCRRLQFSFHFLLLFSVSLAPSHTHMQTLSNRSHVQ